MKWPEGYFLADELLFNTKANGLKAATAPFFAGVNNQSNFGTVGNAVP